VLNSTAFFPKKFVVEHRILWAVKSVGYCLLLSVSDEVTGDAVVFVGFVDIPY